MRGGAARAARARASSPTGPFSGPVHVQTHFSCQVHMQPRDETGRAERARANSLFLPGARANPARARPPRPCTCKRSPRRLARHVHVQARQRAPFRAACTCKRAFLARCTCTGGPGPLARPVHVHGRPGPEFARRAHVQMRTEATHSARPRATAARGGSRGACTCKLAKEPLFGPRARANALFLSGARANSAWAGPRGACTCNRGAARAPPPAPPARA